MYSMLTTFAGFVCSEGQRAADIKQFAYTICAATFFGVLLILTPKSPHKKILWSLIIPLGIIVTLVVLIFGPFFYSSWGCENYIQDLLFRSIQ